MTDSEQDRGNPEKSIGDDTTVQVSMLNQIMESASRKEKFQQYDTVNRLYGWRNSTTFSDEEGEFDTNILNLKQRN